MSIIVNISTVKRLSVSFEETTEVGAGSDGLPELKRNGLGHSFRLAVREISQSDEVPHGERIRIAAAAKARLHQPSHDDLSAELVLLVDGEQIMREMLMLPRRRPNRIVCEQLANQKRLW